MELYTVLRYLADSWVLVMLTLGFLGAIIFAFRPGSRKLQRDAAESIFRNETKPAPDPMVETGSKEVK